MKPIKWEAITAVALCCLVALNALGLVVSMAATKAAMDLGDQEAQYQRGKLAAQSAAHHFILHRVSPDCAGRYIEWLEKQREGIQ